MKFEDYNPYFSVEHTRRPISSFSEDKHIDIDLFDENICDRIIELTPVLDELPSETMQGIIIDSAWKSSKIEGSSYTLADSVELAATGEMNPDKDEKSGLIVRNHLDVLSMENFDLTVDSISLVNKMLLRDIDASGGILRGYVNIDISASSYIPPVSPKLDKMMNILFDAIKNANIINKALYLMTSLPALQLFMDGNKRTSRMSAVHALMQNNILPFSIVNMDKDEYLWSLIAFYETGDTQPIRDIMLDGWAHSIMRTAQKGALSVIDYDRKHYNLVEQLKGEDIGMSHTDFDMA